MSENLNIYEKLGDFILNIIQLVVGGIIFAAIMADESVKGTMLYISAVFVSLVLFALAMLLFKLSSKQKLKYKQ